MLQHSSIRRILKGFPVLIEVDLEYAARLGKLDSERFLALVEGEYTLRRPVTTCYLVESIFSRANQGDSIRGLTEAIVPLISSFSGTNANDKLKNERKVQERDNFLKRKVCREKISTRRQRLIRSEVPPLSFELLP